MKKQYIHLLLLNISVIISGSEKPTTIATTTSSFDSHLEAVLTEIYGEKHQDFSSWSHFKYCTQCFDRNKMGSNTHNNWNPNNMKENSKQLFPQLPVRDHRFIKIYAQLGADLNYTYNDKTPLMAWVSRQDHPAKISVQLKYIETLLQCGADQNIVIDDNYALKIAVNDNNDFIVAALLRYFPAKHLVMETFGYFMQQNTHLSLTNQPTQTSSLRQLWIMRLFITHIQKTDDYHPSDLQW